MEEDPRRRAAGCALYGLARVECVAGHMFELIRYDAEEDHGRSDAHNRSSRTPKMENGPPSDFP